jgi:phage-related protein
MPWRIEYYSEKVRKKVSRLPAGILADYLRIAELFEEFGVDLGMPHSKAIGSGLFEFCPKGREGIARVLYCAVVGKKVIVLHCFVKKTQQTPTAELDIARKRMTEVKNG